MHKCPDSIHKTHTASGLVVKDLCSALQRLFSFLLPKTKFDINLTDFMPNSDAIICFFPSIVMRGQ